MRILPRRKATKCTTSRVRTGINRTTRVRQNRARLARPLFLLRGLQPISQQRVDTSGRVCANEPGLFRRKRPRVVRGCRAAVLLAALLLRLWSAAGFRFYYLKRTPVYCKCNALLPRLALYKQSTETELLAFWMERLFARCLQALIISLLKGSLSV